MNKLSDDERNLLRYYAETERIIHGLERGSVHRHLLRSCYIEERTVAECRHEAGIFAPQVAVGALFVVLAEAGNVRYSVLCGLNSDLA
jgi:hypothetical protein